MAAVMSDQAMHHVQTRRTFLEVVAPVAPEPLVVNRAFTEPCPKRLAPEAEPDEVWYDCVESARDESQHSSRESSSNESGATAWPPTIVHDQHGSGGGIPVGSSLPRWAGSKLESHLEELDPQPDATAQQASDPLLKPPPGLSLDRFETQDDYEMPQPLATPRTVGGLWTAVPLQYHPGVVASSSAAVGGPLHGWHTTTRLHAVPDPVKVERLSSFADHMVGMDDGAAPFEDVRPAPPGINMTRALGPPLPPPLSPPPLIDAPSTPFPPVTAPGRPAQPATPAPQLVAPNMPSPPSWDVALAEVMEAARTERPEVHEANALTVSTLQNGWICVHWAVPGSKLDNRNKQAVSPKWKIPFPGLGEKSFLLVLHPLAVNDQKHGAGFKKAKGKGTVELKYIEEDVGANMPDIVFRICIGGGDKQQTPSPPIRHNFTDHSVAHSSQEWDFASSITEEARTFLVTIAIAPISVRGCKGSSTEQQRGEQRPLEEEEAGLSAPPFGDPPPPPPPPLALAAADAA